MGCSPSKNGEAVIVPKNVSLTHVNVTATEKPHSQSTRYLENCLVIWLCDESSNKYQNEKEQLRKFIYGLKFFNNTDGCVAFITDIQNEKIFLIISGTRRTLEHFYCLSQIEKIYIFDPSLHELNNEQYRTIKYDVSRDINTLQKHLEEDIKLCEMDLLLITVAPLSPQEFSFSSSLSKQQASFLFAQMIKEILYRLKLENGSKDVFIEFCRAHYTNSSEQMHIIDEFARNYRPNKALWWLTNPSFISRILNRVQRTREIDIIYKIGFFIKQVGIQLKNLHEQNESLMEKISVVYRGKTVTSDEFDTLLKKNSGALLSFPNFLLATTDKQVAMDFVQHRLTVHRDMIGVIFEIDLDHTLFEEKNPFALLKDTDINNDEICFHMGSVFRIKSIEQTTNDTCIIWFVKLEVINDNDPQLKPLVAPARLDDMHANPVSYLGKLLIDMGEYRHAELFFVGLMKDPSVRSQPRRLVRAHNGLGALYTFKNDYAKALDHYQQSLQTSLTYLQPDHPDLTPVYRSIADCQMNLSDYINAVKNYETTIELLKRSTQSVNSEIINDLHTRIKKARQSIESKK